MLLCILLVVRLCTIWVYALELWICMFEFIGLGLVVSYLLLVGLRVGFGIFGCGALYVFAGSLFAGI